MVSRDAHLRHDFVQTLADGFDEFLCAVFLAFGHGVDRIKREPGANRFRAIAGEQGEVMHFAHGAGVNHKACASAQPGSDQMMVHTCASQQRGDRNVFRVDAAIAQDQHVVAFFNGFFRAYTELGQRGFHAFCRIAGGIANVQHPRAITALR